jgi:glycosyltransferase involved in cell wall biosynthesis
MAEALVMRGHEIDLVTYPVGVHRDLPFRVHRARRIPGVNALEPGPSLVKFLALDPLLWLKVLELRRRTRHDVIHAHHYEGLLIALANRAALHRDVPIVYDAHTLLSTELPFYRLALPRSLSRRLGDRLDETLPSRADHVVAVGESIEARLVRAGVPASRVTVVPNGVESERFGTADDPSPEAGRRLVFAGNLAAYQGIEYLLEAFRLVREHFRDVRLRLVVEPLSTDGPDRRSHGGESRSLRRVESRARALGVGDAIDIRSANFEGLPEELAMAQIALNPRADCDGVPLKLLNYMAAGRAIVSFASSGRCLDNEVTALLVPDGDVAAFARAIARLLEDPTLAREIGQRARREAERAHAWSRAAERVEAVYESVAADRREAR